MDTEQTRVENRKTTRVAMVNGISGLSFKKIVFSRLLFRLYVRG